MRLVIVLLATIACQLIGSPVFAQRAIPDDNLAYPILVTLSSCSSVPNVIASGFFLNTDTNTYFVTARHVLLDERKPTRPLNCTQAELISYSREPKETGKNGISLDLEALTAAGEVKPHPTHDVVVVRIATATKGSNVANLIKGAAKRENMISGILGVGVSAVRKLDDVLVANDIFIFGYPNSIGLKDAPQIDYSRPLIRKGVVAGINRDKRLIIIDGLTFQGNSGGPVLEIERDTLKSTLHVIGVVSQFVPNVETWLNRNYGYENSQVYNSGYSVIVPMDMVLELIQ